MTKPESNRELIRYYQDQLKQNRCKDNSRLIRSRVEKVWTNSIEGGEQEEIAFWTALYQEFGTVAATFVTSLKVEDFVVFDASIRSALAVSEILLATKDIKK